MSGVEEVLVEIPQGKLKGSKETSIFGEVYYAFQGIPYAKPPVGLLRFKAPLPADKWDGVFDASKRDDRSLPGSNVLMPNMKMPGGCEAALITSVYVRRNPNTITKKLPVIVWIHGGGFITGNGMMTGAGPDMIIRHDVVMVSFNYRLSALGFLSLETSEYPGNYGLKDQRLLLQWVQENISHFGGDPNNVTIFGISAGGASVQYLTLSPSTKGLFKRAISMSGSALNKWALRKSPREYAFALGKKLGCETTDDAELIKFLRTVPADDLGNIGETLCREKMDTRPGEELLQFTFAPTVEPDVEGAFITKTPEQLLNEGSYHDVPMIFGCTEMEMLMVFSLVAKDFSKCDKDEDFEELVPRNLNVEKGSELSLQIARKIRKFYFEGKSAAEGVIDCLSDDFFVYDIYRTAKHQVSNRNRKSPTYLYIFTKASDFSLLKLMNIPEPPGAGHGDDGMYIINMSIPGVDAPKKVTPGSEAEVISKRLTVSFTNFACTGNPSSDVEWKPAEAGKFQYLDIGDVMKIKDGFFRERMSFWDEIFDLVNTH